MQFQEISRSPLLQTQNPFNRKLWSAAFSDRIHSGRHNNWFHLLNNNLPSSQHANYWQQPNINSVKWFSLCRGCAVTEGSVLWMDDWGTCEAAGIQTTNCLFKWERRIYTGRQLEIRSDFYMWMRFPEVPYSSLPLLCVLVYVLLRDNTFSLLVSQFNAATVGKKNTHWQSYVCIYVCVCIWVVPYAIHCRSGCEIRMRSS